jgi:hypothetical protein
MTGLLAVVSRADFPTGSGPAGDCHGLRALVARHPEWEARVLELAAAPAEVSVDGASFRVGQHGWTVDLAEVRTALYLPVCLEPEETLLHAVAPDASWPRFETEQWRPLTAAFEDRLDALGCLNRPLRSRAANNKLIQYERLRAAGIEVPAMRVGATWPTGATSPQLVAKNLSEGGWRSPTEFSPARLRSAGDALDGWPVIWQEVLDSDRELRCYVMGGDVTTVELRREPGVLDVRTANDGRPRGQVLDAGAALPAPWLELVRRSVAVLGLDYGVIDAIPVGGRLHLLEVNANGVWWFLPDDVGAVLQGRFDAWVETAVAAGA